MKNYFKPTYLLNSIYDLDFNKLKAFKYVFLDLDNTLASPYDAYPSKKIIDFINKLKKDHKIYLISNNNELRVKKFNEKLTVNYFYHLKKPNIKRLKKYMIAFNIKNEDVIYIGDQIMTDVLLANRLNIKSILLQPLTNIDEPITFIPRLLDKFFRLFCHNVRKF